MWYNTTHTAVTVYHIISLNETYVQLGDDVGTPLVLKLPNPNNRGEGSYMDNGGPAGGPQYRTSCTFTPPLCGRWMTYPHTNHWG